MSTRKHNPAGPRHGPGSPRAQARASYARVVRSRWHWVHSTRLHVVLYGLLLVATPFLLLQNFLVEWIGALSDTRVPLAGLRLPIVPAIAGLAFVAFLIIVRRKIARRHVAVAAIVVLMDALAQQITDYYFGHNFFDLQQNWHYIAYGLFAYVLYRDLAPRGFPLSRIMLLTGCCTLVMSTFDEGFQMRMSNRVFDVGDISKDQWGMLMGMVVIYGGGPHSRALWGGRRRLWHPHLGDYVREPLTTLVWMIVGGFIFLCISALLTEVEYLWVAVTATAITFLVFFLIIHLAQFRWSRRALAVVLVGALGTEAYCAYRDWNGGISYAVPNLTVYHGMPLPLFDLLFFADGTFRPVDKKHDFNNRDQRTLLRYRPDVLIIGSGYQGRGGNGFPDRTPCQFIYNQFTGRGTEVFILPSPQACELYNRLRREQRNVLFVLHTGC